MKTLGLGICNQRRVGQYYLSFNGVDAGIELGGTLITQPTDFSISSYCEMTGSQSAWNMVAAIGNGVYLARYNDYFRFYMNDGATHYISATTEQSQGWCKLVGTFTYADLTMKFFLNGNYIGSTTINDYATMQSIVSTIGFHYSGYRFNGNIASCAIYNAALLESEIQSLYGKDFIDDSRLVHRWDFSEGAGLILHDKIGTVDGAISNATWQMGIIT